MTDRYRHLLEGQGQEAADRFDRYVAAQLARVVPSVPFS